MSSSFEQRAEDRLIQAVRQKRRQRQARVMVGGALAMCLGLWLALQQRVVSGETPTEAVPFVALPENPPLPIGEAIPEPELLAPIEPAKPYTLISTQAKKFSAIESGSTRLMVVRTGEFSSTKNIDDQELFAQFPNARIRIDSDGQAELIVPESGNQ
ncbi:MAG: hypothetical protein AAFX93_14280 [Verrucomicrobiota bacterium]